MLKLYASTTTTFTNNGYGVLTDFVSNPIITEVLNAEYTLEFNYLINGSLSEYLVQENIIKANGQLFRISMIKKDLESVRILAKHIVFDLSHNFLVDVYPQDLTAGNALDWLLDHAEEATNFTVWSDMIGTDSARYVRKSVIEAMMSADNSILATWGGEYEFDNFTIKIHAERGENRGLVIRYGKNMTGVEYNLDFSNVITKILPLGKDALMIDNVYVESSHISDYAMPYIAKVEFDIGIDENTDEATAKALLESTATDYFTATNCDLPKVSVKVDFIELSKTLEYANYSALESAYLGDTVRFIASHLNIDTTTRVIRTEYDCLLKRLVKIELGTVTSDYVNNNAGKIDEIEKKLDDIDPAGIYNDAVANATEQIVQAMGGYVYKTQNELYIMNTDDTATATKVWRWNLGGLGYSSTGVNGPYETAITQDGAIVANFITVGQLNVAQINGLSNLLDGKQNSSILLDDENIKLITSRVSTIETDGVSKVSNTIVTIDDEGVSVNQSESDMTTTITSNGLYVYRDKDTNDEVLMLKANSQIVEAENITVRTYLVIGNKSRMEDYSDGTGVFFIG